MKAVILAAGVGTRLQSLTSGKPKCLLEVGGETILDRQLRILEECRIDGTVIVTGYQSQELSDRARYPRTTRIGNRHTSVYNPRYADVGSILSLHAARHLINGDALVINADVVFTSSMIQLLMSTDENYCLLVDNKPCDWEATKVVVRNGTVLGIGKTIPYAFGEYTGIALVRETGLADFKRCLVWCARDEPDALTPAVFQALIKGGYRVGYTLVDEPWIEIDTPEDYKEARRLFG